MAAIKPHELKNRLDTDSSKPGSPAPLVIDVREPGPFSAGTIPGAVNVPYEDGVAPVLARFVDRRRPVILICGWGHKSAIAGIALKREGFRDLRYLEGGLEAWGLAGLPIGRGTSRLDEQPTLPDDSDRRQASAGE